MNDDEQAPAQELSFEIVPAPVQPALRHAITLSNLWNVWIGLKSTHRPKTIKTYRMVAAKFCAFFESKEYGGEGHKLSPEGMVEWMQHLQSHRTQQRIPRPVGPGHINKINTISKAFLRWMRQMNYVSQDLASCIPTLMTAAPKESVIITEEDYEKVKKYCAGRDNWQPHLWLIILGYRTGMSLVDCCHLRWKDIHLDDDGPSYIDIYRIKTERLGEKAKCQIPIVPYSDLHLWLLNLKNVIPWKRADGIADYVHQETPGLYKSTFATVAQDFKTIFRQAGVDDKKTFKCLRNSLCSNLVNSGMQIANVCKITGHQSVEMLLRYLKPDRRVLQDGMAAAQQYSARTVAGGKQSTGIQDGDAAFL